MAPTDKPAFHTDGASAHLLVIALAYRIAASKSGDPPPLADALERHLVAEMEHPVAMDLLVDAE